MKNPYIKLEIAQISLAAKNFVNSCRTAAMKDDGTIDEEEQKTIKKISKATEKYLRELERIEK